MEPDTTGQPPIPSPSFIAKARALAESFLRTPHIKSIGIGLLVVVVLGGIIALGGALSSLPFFVPQTNYVPVYTLVNDKISEHGAIIVNLPKGVSKEEAGSKVTFEPALKGQWVTSSLPDALVYKPASALTLGRHYLVSLALADGAIQKDFVVDEDPAVVSIFPDDKAEAELASAITIVFNRPMVPLTTLSELDAKSIPVTITPATPGKFKWITTRTLQFIPTTTLYGSAHYSVTIKPDFVSMDGLPVPGKTYSFTTKQLRLDHSTISNIVYNQPIQFFFNEPVDLQKTLPEISVKGASGTVIDLDVSYGKRRVWDSTSRNYKEVPDKSIISIVPKNSLYGHANIWDFSAVYTASIHTVYPIGGDIALKGSTFAPSAAQTTVTTSSVIKDSTVHSDATSLASPTLFDPNGTVSVTFYEEINLGKSSISAKGLNKITYGEKCMGQDTGYYSRTPCIKTEDKSVLIFSFDPLAYARGEQVTLSFDKLVNSGGYQVNPSPLSSLLTVYPVLKILKTVPAAGATDGSISALIFCTNVPLKPQDADAFHRNFNANKRMVFGRFNNPYVQTDNSYEKPPPCLVGQYVNRISYGLLPEQAYTIQGSLEDVFGQKASTNLAFTTGAAPAFYLRFQNLQPIYNVTTPDHTKLTYTTENFDYVNVSICKVSPQTMVNTLAQVPSEVDTRSPGSFSCTESASDKISLKDEDWVSQYFQLDVKNYFSDPRGQYVITFSHPSYKDSRGALYAHSFLSVTNLAVADDRVRWSSNDYQPDVPDLTPSDTRGSVYFVSQMQTQQPVGNALVSLYSAVNRNQYRSPVVLATTHTTNQNGITEFPLVADVAGATITAGDDTAVVTGWTDTLSQGYYGTGYQTERVYIYSDRPIYRPGQEVFIKGIYRVNFDGTYQIFRDKDIDLQISDSKGNQVMSQKVAVSAYGTFSTSLKLPTDAPLGSYYISAEGGSGYFDVEEYVGAAFETTASLDKDEYIAGETADISILGKYYFGVPLDGGTLDYTLTSQNFYFDRYKDDYFNFGGGWYNCYDCGYGDSYLKSGSTPLDGYGAAELKIPLDFDTLYTGTDGDSSKIMVFHGTIKDKQGKSVSFEKSFIVHRGEYYLGAKADPYFMAAKQPFTLKVKTVDTSGKSVSKSGITVVINKVDWQYNKRQEVDGGYYNRSARVLTPVMTKHVITNGSGDYSEQITLTDPGEYEIDAVGKDGRGNSITSSSGIYVFGPGTVTVRPTNNATLNLSAEKTDLKVGDTAKFIIQNPYPHAKALISIERGRIFSYEVVSIDQSIYQYEFPITEEYTPNVYASVILLSPDPGVKFGQLQFTVDRKEKELTVNVATDQQSYLPGQKVNLTITTTDSSGTKVPSDVSVSVADVSVLALKGNPKKDPLVFFYNGFPLTVTAETNVKNLLIETPIPTGTKGGGGGDVSDLATHTRGEFKDTAFWQANVLTDASGVAHVSFTLPDNLTKWQVESLGITKDTKVGVSYNEIIAQKQVMTIPIAPRFVVPGDKFMLGAKIFNQSSDTQSLEVSLVSPTLTLSGSQKVTKVIPAGQSNTVYFSVQAPLAMNEGAHVYTLSAKNAVFNDTVEKKIPITRNMTYESTATAGSSNAAKVSEYLYLPDSVLTDRGGLTIKTSATLAVYLTDALTYLFQYPYGCSEQLAAKLSSIAIAKRALNIPNVGSQFKLPTITLQGTTYTVDQAVTMGLSQIYDNQNDDGGLAYYKGLKSDPYLTMYVLSTLLDVQKAGYKVQQSVIVRASAYLYSQISYFKSQKNTDSLIYLAYVLTASGQYSGDSASLRAYIEGQISTGYLSDRASSETLGYLALLSTHGFSKADKDKIYAALINRVDIDARGAYVKPKTSNMSWYYYETTEKDTALLLKALVADGRSYAETDDLIRWLIASRTSDGSWGSTNTSVAAIDALTDYLVWKRETESSFNLATLLDGKSLSSTDFSAKNILSSVETVVPIKDIELAKTHTLTFAKTNANTLPNTFYYDMSLKYYLPIEQIGPRDEGVALTRDFYSLTDPTNSHPLSEAKVGDVVRGVLTIVLPKNRNLFAVEDYIPAGFELVNFNLATEDASTETKAVGTADTNTTVSAKSTIGGGILAALGLFGSGESTDDVESPIIYRKFYPDFQEMHDDRLFLFAQNVAPGAYRYEYYVRATTPGTFNHLPAVASDLYYPENFGRTAGSLITVGQ